METCGTEEPYEGKPHVRTCGGAGWATTGSTRIPDRLPRPVRRSSSCSIPIVDGKDSEEYPWVSGLPEPERARGQEPAGKAESGEKTLKPRLGETRVTWRKLDGLKANPIRSL